MWGIIQLDGIAVMWLPSASPPPPCDAGDHGGVEGGHMGVVEERTLGHQVVDRVGEEVVRDARGSAALDAVAAS